MPSLLDILVTERLAAIDHGLGKPRGGDFTIVKKLQKDLLKEQDEAHGGDREDLGKKWGFTEVVIPDNYAVDRLFATTDLYQDMCEADDVVSVERFNMTENRSAIRLPSGRTVVENFYTARMVYHMDVARHLEERGTALPQGEKAAQLLHNASPQFNEYIGTHGAQGLLGKWLPGEPDMNEYDLLWEVTSCKNTTLGQLDLELKISERWIEHA